jgi:hypothetical protein
MTALLVKTLTTTAVLIKGDLMIAVLFVGNLVVSDIVDYWLFPWHRSLLTLMLHLLQQLIRQT